MEFSLSGNQIKAFHRAVSCLAKIGNELLMEALPDKLTLRTLNASRSAFLAIPFKAYFFDAYQLLIPLVQCNILLKAVCTIFRMPPSSMERITIILPDMTATKLQWTLECLHGIRKTYWITCSNDPDMQHISLDCKSCPSHLVVKPSDLNRLLANFQSSLQEITLIATEPSPLSSFSTRTSSEGKAIELRSYIDPVKETNDPTLHTQLWIDPTEELQEYRHRGDAVDVTFSLKDLKAFLAFCEGCEADMHMYFERAGKPILLAPRFGLDDSDHADFDATLMLATMLGSQLGDAENSEIVPPQFTMNPRIIAEVNDTALHNARGPRSSSQNAQQVSILSTKSIDEQSNHTKVWSELSGSATKSMDHRDVKRGPKCMQKCNDASVGPVAALQLNQMNNEHTAWPGRNADQFSSASPASSGLMRGDLPGVTEAHGATVQQHSSLPTSQNITFTRNPGNWLSADTEEEEEDVCVQSTPPQERCMM